MKRCLLVFLSAGFVTFLLLARTASAQMMAQSGGDREGRILFEQNCTSCHGNAHAEVRAPDRETLMKLTPEAIFAALTTGPMRFQAKDLTEEQKRKIARHLSGRPFGAAEAGDAKQMPNRCAANPPLSDPSAGPAWNGWGSDILNTRFQPAKAAGLSADQVPHLKLKWAFGFPYGVDTYGQPTIASGRVFVGSDNSYVYSLDAVTGCVYWSFLAEAGVRTAISIGPVKGQGSAEYAAYFGDIKGNAYAVNAATSELLWRTHVEDHPLGRLTGAPKLFGGRLYVPVASMEEAISIDVNYPCCTFRGSVVALDANTGQQIWKSYVIPERPHPTTKNSVGTQFWAPAGAGVWNSPTIDVKRHALYVGTGDAYTAPAAETSDAIVAIDLNTGKILWVFQGTSNDTWMSRCSNPASRTENCPKDMGPDWDFAASPILRTLPNGRQVLVAAGKSGIVYGLDPDRNGALLWKRDLSDKDKPPDISGLIVFGGTADEQNAYYALNLVGGMAALRLATGQRRWFTPLAPAAGTPGGPRPGQSAAVTSIPGVVFSGGWDGVLHALSTTDGHVLWEYNTAQEFKTVNGVAANGGSMGGPGPTVAGNMLFVGSGYVGVGSGMPGNVLLAFAPE